MLVRDLVPRYLEWATSYYVKPNGRPTREAQNMEHALRHLMAVAPQRTLESLEVEDIKFLREHIIDQGICRPMVNARVTRCRRFVKWCIENKYVDQYALLPWQLLKPLAYSRSRAPERDPVESVPHDIVQKTIDQLMPTVARMVALQYITGMRSSELCLMKWEEIDQSGDAWIYRPKHHKTRHWGHTRAVPLLDYSRNLLGKPSYSYVFVNQHGNPYNEGSYRIVIQRAAKRAGVPRWSPHQLRHSAATRWADAGGIEIARQLMGHASISMTVQYLDRSMTRVVESAKKVEEVLTSRN